MKRALVVLGQVILMLLAALAITPILTFSKGFAATWHPLHIVWHTATPGRIFEADWIIAALLVALFIAFIELLCKRIRTGWQQIAIAFVIVLLLGFAMSLGWRTIPLSGL